MSCAKQTGAVGTQHGLSVAHVARDPAADFVIVPLQSLMALQEKKKWGRNCRDFLGSERAEVVDVGSDGHTQGPALLRSGEQRAQTPGSPFTT